VNSKTSIPSRSTVILDTVNGDLELGRHTTVKASKAQATVTVLGMVYCEGDDVFECSLSAENLEAEGTVGIQGDLEIKGTVEVEDGSLEVYGNMTAEKIDVDRTLYVKENFTGTDVDVGGSMEVEGNAKAENIEVGGTFDAKGAVTAESIEVGGSLTVGSISSIKSLEVGGSATVTGGRRD
jgi:cytoskeletal protein CcmA (bactofilin family)